MRLYACCGLLLCPAYPQHFAHGYVDKIPGYPGRAGTLTGNKGDTEMLNTHTLPFSILLKHLSGLLSHERIHI